MTIKRADELSEIGVRIFDAVGSPHEESKWVMETLVRANLMGHDSHGFLRVPFYTDQIQKGELKPGSRIEVEKQSRAMALINGNNGWGQVIARAAMSLAIEKARQESVCVVSVRNCQHVGRLGEWVSMAAAENMVGLAFANSCGGAGPVAPWGGIDRRLKPNPIAFAAPSGEEWPVLVDISTTVVASGKVESALLDGKQLPEGSLIDANGNPTNDPAVFFGSPPGALLTMGGAVGHKGYGLNIMAELIAGALSASGCSGQLVPNTMGNGLFFEVVNIADLVPVAEFIATVQELVAWVKSSRKRPGVAEILFPGESEYNTAKLRIGTGVPVPDQLWNGVLDLAKRVGALLPG